MTKPSFSIVVPVYGVEKYIGRCAETLFSQTYDNIQFVFVNDGTKDKSMEVLAEVLEGYQHLKDRVVIVNKENGGLPAARKTGMEYVTGDYVLHVDSDDWLELDAVEQPPLSWQSSHRSPAADDTSRPGLPPSPPPYPQSRLRVGR